MRTEKQFLIRSVWFIGWVGWLILSSISATALNAAAAPKPVGKPTSQPSQKTVQTRARSRTHGPKSVWLGSAVSLRPLFSESKYQKHIREEYSIVTPENAFKMEHLQPEEGKFQFAEADKLVEFAIKNKLLVRGHVLVWHEGLPQWLQTEKRNSDRLRSILKSHIQTVLRHFRESKMNPVLIWDLANELFDDQGVFRKDSIWGTAFESPVELMSNVVKWAREADPQVQLFYNDYGIETSSPKSESVYQMLKTLKGLEVKLDGVGFQMHHELEQRPKQADMMKVFKRYADLGLKIHITEYDVAIPDSLPAKKAFQKQAQHYALTAQLCTQLKACEAFSTWGFWDQDSWLPQLKPGMGRPLIVDHQWKKKPAYYSLKRHLRAKRGFPSQSKRSNKVGND